MSLCILYIVRPYGSYLDLLGAGLQCEHADDLLESANLDQDEGVLQPAGSDRERWNQRKRTDRTFPQPARGFYILTV